MANEKVIILGLIFCIMGMAGLFLCTYYRWKVAQKPSNETNIDLDIDLSEEELGLICIALSDSMNYKKEDRFQEKWHLLLKCKTYQVRMEDKGS